MIKQASVAITTILGVALPLFAATLDPVSWGVYILFSIVVDFRLYFYKVRVSNEDRVQFHSRNLLSNKLWKDVYIERNCVNLRRSLLALLSNLSIALQAKAFYLSRKDPLTYVALQVFVYWTKSPSESWWFPCALTYFFFSAEAFLLARSANAWLLADCALQLLWFGSEFCHGFGNHVTALLVTPISCFSVPSYVTPLVVCYLCLRSWNKKVGVGYIQQRFHIPLTALALSIAHWDLRTFSCAVVSLVVFCQRRIQGHRWDVWSNVLFWQMTIMQSAMVDWMHIYVSLFY